MDGEPRSERVRLRLPASARDPETVINGFKNGPEWKVLTSQQQTDAVAGIRKAGTGSCD